MQPLEFAVEILSAVLGLAWLARRVSVNEPVALIVGVVLRFVPEMSEMGTPEHGVQRSRTTLRVR